MDIKTLLIVELYKLLSKACPKSDYNASVKLPCGSELIVTIKVKNKLEIVKTG